MKLFNILIDEAPFKVVLSLLLGILTGIGYALLIPVVMSSLETNGDFPALNQGNVWFFSFEVSHFRFAALFFLSCIVIIVARTYSQLLLSWVAIDVTSQLRRKYYDTILQAPLEKLEKVGSPRLIASITTDVKTVIQGAQHLPDLLISGVTALGMLLFLLYLNTDLFWFVCKAIVFGAVTFQIPLLLASRFFRRARHKIDTLHEGIRGNIQGVKELKLCAEKRNDYMKEVLLRSEDDVRRANKRGLTILRSAMNYGDMISLFVIGFSAFVFVNRHSVSPEELTGAIMVLLYISAPISVVLGSIPDLVSANVSLKAVDKLFSEMPQEEIAQTMQELPLWQTLHLRGVSYRYEVEGERSGFGVGPIDFEIHRGETTFIVGGNGSGKSTVGKLISAHYFPEGGTVSLGQQAIDREWIATYRNQLSLISTDFYLFDRLFGAAKHEDEATIRKYLEWMQLDHKLTLTYGRVSTLSLSDGQRKRLALVVALLEDKSIYLFDDWAADQDPEFKKAFYHDVLPYLKSRNKAVVVISHDDRYFDAADRIYVMESGMSREMPVPGRLDKVIRPSSDPVKERVPEL
ncbi:MAG: cyclic peptide export ABC transporter [Lysobacteraceae bacterium]